jgi:branched-chain amino acid transport system ATP-binding protein
MADAVLRAERLTKTFGGNTAVADVDLAVAPGELLCIIGPNGAGKTTLFNLLTKDLVPTSGRILVEGHDVTALRPYQISRLGVARSYQITSVFPGLSAFDNVWIAAYRHRRQGRLNFWRAAGGFAELPDLVLEVLDAVGLRARVHERAEELSYGDQRLLEIAVTLATAPRLILLDEPTSGLSQDETGRVARLIRSLAERYTVVMIEHKMSVAMTISDRLVVMNFGQVIANGPPAEVADDPDVKRAYFGG